MATASSDFQLRFVTAKLVVIATDRSSKRCGGDCLSYDVVGFSFAR